MSNRILSATANFGRIIFLSCGVWASLSSLALAQDLVFKSTEKPTTLIELFTSEGCSSCPPAENWLAQLKTNPGLWNQIVPVVFHVDYWDNLGWPDRFARPEFTQYQRDYAQRLHQDSVYTPEFIVDGQEWKGWLTQQKIPAQGTAAEGVLSLDVKNQGAQLSASYSATAPAPGKKLNLQIAWLGANLISDVKRGENAGHTLHQEFVVLAFTTVPLTLDKSGTGQSKPLTAKFNTTDKPSAVAAWVTSEDGHFIQAVGGWLKPDTKNRDLRSGGH